MSNVDTKLDQILASLSGLNSKFDRLENKVTVLQDHSAQHDRSIASLEDQVFKLKEACNHRDQDSRNTVIRVFNFPVIESEVADGSKGLSTRIYDKVLKPILQAAKNKGEIAALPQLQTIMSECFRTRSTKTSAPPPVIFKFTSVNHKVAVMRNKRDNIPQLSGPNSNPIFIVEDLTPDTHQRMMELKLDRRIAKIWTVNGQIRLTLVASPLRVLKVKSAYEDIERMLG